MQRLRNAVTGFALCVLATAVGCLSAPPRSTIPQKDAPEEAAHPQTDSQAVSTAGDLATEAPTSTWDPIFDDDGALDISEFLDSSIGFVPVVIPVTEPAVGNGAAGGLAFIHGRPPPVTTASGKVRRIPPDISVVGGATTENGTWAGVLAHKAHWREDQVRYVGALAYFSVNLDYRGQNNDQRTLGSIRKEVNFEGLALFQRLQLRLFDTNLFAGLQYTFVDVTTRFKDSVVPGIANTDFESNTAAAEIIVTWDSLDNPFTPTDGYRVELTGGYADELLGGDFNYYRFGVKSFGYWPLLENLYLAARVESAAVGDDAPLYGLKTVLIRGIPAAKYLGDVMAVAETEIRWQFADRWSVLGFVGIGGAARDYSKLGDAEHPVSGGGGFRYLLASAYGLHAGIDVAVGPEGVVTYFTIGNAWVF